MSSDFAETAVAEPVGAEAFARVRADPERMAALRDVWRALWVSRLVVWIAGAGTVATLGFGPLRHAFDPPGSTSGFGRSSVSGRMRVPRPAAITIARVGPFTSYAPLICPRRSRGMVLSYHDFKPAKAGCSRSRFKCPHTRGR